MRLLSIPPTPLLCGSLLLLCAGPAISQRTRAPYPRFARGRTLMVQARGSDMDKLEPVLRHLYFRYAPTRGNENAAQMLSAQEVQARFGIAPDDRSPTVQTLITLADAGGVGAVKQAGAAVWQQSGRLLFAAVPVRSLAHIAERPEVSAIEAISMTRIPPPPAAARPIRFGTGKPLKSRGAQQSAAFDAQGQTGKGVLAAIIDSGIAWDHADFRNPDGSSRIVALWDTYDDSWETSGGKIGSKPPLDNPLTHKPLGTLYTQEQITAALRGRGEIHSKDEAGHGTACAGIAVGSGRAAGKGGAPGASAYQGLAPDADLLVVKVAPSDASGQLNDLYAMLACAWSVAVADARKQPLVISLSFGSQFTAHDGQSPEELAINGMCGAAKPGVVICAAAGNDGRAAFHASGVFGPERPGQQDIESLPVETQITRPTALDAYFDHRDEWGLAVTGLDKFLADANGKPISLLIYREGERIRIKMSGDPVLPADPQVYLQQALAVNRPLMRSGKTDAVYLDLPPGRYAVQAFAHNANVVGGHFDLYLRDPDSGSFLRGATSTGMVGTPGNAANIITVGSYDFRGEWDSQAGTRTAYNLQPGQISYYTSPGYRLDGMVKPTITAPARYAISALAPGSQMAAHPGASHITADGRHVAWEGTSAATPYAAGVIALMLQKNPHLDAAQTRAILSRTATQDAFTGAVPNPQWGYGKINPAAAIKAAGLLNTAGGKPAAPAARPPVRPTARPGAKQTQK